MKYKVNLRIDEFSEHLKDETFFNVCEAVSTMMYGDDVDFNPISEEEKERIEKVMDESLEDLEDYEYLYFMEWEKFYKNVYCILIEEGYMNNS